MRESTSPLLILEESSKLVPSEELPQLSVEIMNPVGAMVLWLWVC